MYRRYCREDVEVDIETSTKVETAKRHGRETERNEIGNKNRTTEERVDCEIEEY